MDHVILFYWFWFVIENLSICKMDPVSGGVGIISLSTELGKVRIGLLFTVSLSYDIAVDCLLYL